MHKFATIIITILIFRIWKRLIAKNEAIAYNISTASKPVELAFSHALTALTFAVDAEMIPGKVKLSKTQRGTVQT